MFQTSSGFNFKSVLNFIHFLYDSGPNCLLFISDDSYREILTVILVHSLSFVFFVHVSDAILYWILYLYTGPSIFDLIIFYLY